MLNYTQLSHPWTSYWVQILNSTCCFCGCRICCTKNRLVQSINTFILKARKYWHTLYISRYTLTSGSSSKKGVFIAVTNIENPMRKRNRTVMNFPRSISKLKTIIYYKLNWDYLKSKAQNLEMIIAQGPNMWWNFRKSKIWTIPKRNDQARNWFLKKINNIKYSIW